MVVFGAPGGSMGSDERGPSFTARVVATYRARHQVIGDVPIFRDPFAGPLLGDDVVPLDDDNRYVVRARHFIVARARAADDLLRAAVARGVRRCVVLGAGLDT
ncbi:MAG: class I SAM-dependent methyltransferase, partial [Myxococcales bacterium]|nr:class I SAM-dependent methyltransferase [Myxococcales bacterium]